MRFMVVVKATKDSEAGVMPEEKLIAEEVRQLFELEDFGPSQAVERVRDMRVGTKK
jgi:hypothetical protein